MNTNFIIHEPAGEYHARSRGGDFMSSHLLADFRESPALYRKEIDIGLRILAVWVEVFSRTRIFSNANCRA